MVIHRDSALLLAAMEEAAKEAGKVQMAEFRRRPGGWGDLKAARDLVSFVDLESEKAIRAVLTRALPGAAFYGEETEKTLGPGATWVVDPLDGTTNYLSGFDYFSVSIALWTEEGTELALIYKPSDGELFTAERGKGAWSRGQRLPQATRLDPLSALIGTGTPYRTPETTDAFFESTRRVLASCRDIRRTGSAALDLSYLAAGYLQGFWEVDLQPYDVAAGLLMLSETGHPFSSFRGEKYKPFTHRSFVTGRPGVFETLQKIACEEYKKIDFID
ncbi:hypothetical protein MASR2M78_30900 [Treponema sp.]